MDTGTNNINHSQSLPEFSRSLRFLFNLAYQCSWKLPLVVSVCLVGLDVRLQVQVNVVENNRDED